MSGDFTFLKGNIETIILCSLYNGNKYGYEIAKEIKERTNNRYEIKQPTLYAYLKRLEEDDLIVSYWGENSNGGRRRYYALTKTGRANCEQFISEWQYHREVLNDLVDGTANGVEISQEDATPLFGRRSPRRAKRNEFQEEMDQQDEISRRLRELTGTSETEQEEPAVEENEEEKPVTEEPPAEVVEEEVPEQQPESEEQVVVEEQQPAVEEEPQQPVEEEQEQSEQQEQAEDPRARFEVNQDRPEEFIQNFDERARVLSEQQSADSGENYQHVLNNILGDQLDDADRSAQQAPAAAYYEDRHAALEDVADSLAKEGIRLRIYNHATATYKSKMLIPQAKVLCETSWLTYIVAVIYFGVFALCSIAIGNWQPFVIALAILMLVPIGFTIYAIVDPTRKNKPSFNFKIAMVIACTVCVIIVLASVGISALSNVEFSNFEQTSRSIMIPLGVAILIPTFIGIYEVLYKQY